MAPKMHPLSGQSVARAMAASISAGREAQAIMQLRAHDARAHAKKDGAHDRTGLRSGWSGLLSPAMVARLARPGRGKAGQTK